MKRSSSWLAVLPSLVIPVCVGMTLYLGLQYLIDQSVIADEMVLRYLTGHPVSNVTVGMFFVGLASLAMIAKNVFDQFGSEKRIALQPESTSESTSPEDIEASLRSGPEDMAVDFGQSMLELPQWMQQHYLWNRIVNALHYIYRTGSVAGVEDEMKYLAEMDQDRQQQRYSLARILIWATPMLGFLGTVLGISQALGGIAVGPENDFQQMMDGLRGSLYVAFDTTALALTLSMVLMFLMFLVDRFESQLLTTVDQRSRSEIARQFDLTATTSVNGTTNGQEVVLALREAAKHQSEIWRTSIRAAEQAWTASLTQTSDVVRSGLTESLDENVASLAHYLGEAIEKADMSMSHRWEQWQVTLSENARMMEKHQGELAEQTSVVKTLLEKAEDSSTFKQALAEHEKAIQATTKTHDVLAQLSQAIAKANPVQRMAIHEAPEFANVPGKFELSDIVFPTPPSEDIVESNHDSNRLTNDLEPSELEEIVSGQPNFDEMIDDLGDEDAAAQEIESEVDQEETSVVIPPNELATQQKPAEPDVVFYDRFQKKDKKSNDEKAA